MRRLSLLVLTGIFLLFLPACFDYQVSLDLKPDGSGSVAFRLNVPQQYNITWQTPMVQRILSPQPVAPEPYLINQEAQFDEQAHFNYLGELRLNRIAWSVSMIDTGLLGITSYTYRITTFLMGTEGIPAPYNQRPSGFQRQQKEIMPWESSQASEKALTLRAQAAEDHMLTIVQSLPGRVVKADSIELGDFVVEPIIEGNQVTWEIPLAQLIVNDVRNNLQFSADFRGSYEPHISFRPAWASRMN